MAKNKLASALLITIITLEFFKVDHIQAESNNTKFSSESLRSFNPFSISSWASIPSQFMQYWFPLFQPAYYPSYLQKPSTTKRPTASVTTELTTSTGQTSPSPPPTESQNMTEREKENSKSKTDNIFGVSGSPGDSIEYLPSPNEIECCVSNTVPEIPFIDTEWIYKPPFIFWCKSVKDKIPALRISGEKTNEGTGFLASLAKI